MKFIRVTLPPMMEDHRQVPNARHNKYPNKLQAHHQSAIAVKKQQSKGKTYVHHAKAKDTIMAKLIKTIYVLECPECGCRLGTTKIARMDEHRPKPNKRVTFMDTPKVEDPINATPPPSQPPPAEEEPFACTPEVTYPTEQVDASYLEQVDNICSTTSDAQPQD